MQILEKKRKHKTKNTGTLKQNETNNHQSKNRQIFLHNCNVAICSYKIRVQDP